MVIAHYGLEGTSGRIAEYSHYKIRNEHLKTRARLQDDKSFTKRMFRYLINDNVIPGNWLCLALFSQGVLKDDPQARAGLAMGDSAYTYNFIKSKIYKT